MTEFPPKNQNSETTQLTLIEANVLFSPAMNEGL